jgi:hypothetical protein
MRDRVSTLAVLGFVLVSGRALADESMAGASADGVEGFGKTGVINVASDLSFSVQSTMYSAPSGQESPASATAYSIGPAADVFVIDNLSVGGQILFGQTAVSDLKTDTFRIAPRVGYHISLVPERFGLWPRLEFGYQTSTNKLQGSPDSTDKAVQFGAFVPLLIHPVEHFHIGIGPFLDTDLSAKTDGANGIKETTIGLRTEIAGWWML